MYCTKSHRVFSGTGLRRSGLIVRPHWPIRALPISTGNTDDARSKGPREGVFPWRHDVDRLERLTPGTEDYERKNHLLSTTGMRPGNPTINSLATAYMFLDVPLLQMPFFGSWKAELAESMSWAFLRGVSALLSSVYKVPSGDQVIQDYKLSVKTTLGEPSVEPRTQDESKEEYEGLHSMLEAKLVDMYSQAQKTIDGNYLFDLDIEVKTSTLVSLYCIPYVSRSNIAQDEPLLAFYRNMLEKPSMARTSDLEKLRREKMETGLMESTVIAQVLVDCSEVFKIRREDSAEVVQDFDDTEGGDGECKRNVPHLVRMEATVKTERIENGYRNVKGNWIITDIDDLVDGNLIV